MVFQAKQHAIIMDRRHKQDNIGLYLLHLAAVHYRSGLTGLSSFISSLQS